MKRQRRLITIASYVIVLTALVVFLFPIAWLIIGSLKPPAQIMEMGLAHPPHPPNPPPRPAPPPRRPASF
jgi:ABC-type glycerol-3-phosphate transport system permease component